MDAKELDEVIERSVRCTKGICAILQRGVTPDPHGEDKKKILSCEKSCELLFKTINRLDTLTDSTPDHAEKAACATAWLYAQIDWFDDIVGLLEAVKDQTAVVTSSSSSLLSRRLATDAINLAGNVAVSHVKQACKMTRYLQAYGSTAADTALADMVVARVTQRGFMQAAADAMRGMLAVTVMLHSESGVQELTSRTFNAGGTAGRMDALLSTAAVAVCLYLELVTETLHNRLHRSQHQATAARSQPSVPAVVTQIVESLKESQLLAAAAAALVDSPNALAAAGLPEAARSRVCREVRRASTSVCQAVYSAALLQDLLAKSWGPAGRRLASGVLRLLQHGAVRRLQVGLLDLLAADAGLGAGLGEQGQGGGHLEVGEGARQQPQQQQQGAVWASSSGTWWMAREEARRGELLGSGAGGAGGGSRQDGSSWVGQLENQHVQALCVTVGVWHSEVVDRAAAMGVDVRPAPLLEARFVARAVEALCRLCRGEGLGGAYGPSPEWLVPKIQPRVLQLLHRADQDASLPVATAQACLPYWLEAAGWLMALMADATAAAMGRLPASRYSGAPRSHAEKQAKDGSQAQTLGHVLKGLKDLAGNGEYGFQSLPAAAQADVRRRLFRCGLAASLDHTLRLAFSAQAGGHKEVAIHLDRCIMWMWEALNMRAVPMLPPTGTRGSAGEAQGSSSSGGHGGGCSEEHQAQLGFLHTLAKQAAVVSRALEAAQWAADGTDAEGVAERRKKAVYSAMSVLMALATAMAGLHEQLEQGAWLGQGAEAEEAPGVEQAAGGAVSGQERPGRVVEKACDTLAFAARAACTLGAVLAWELSNDMAAMAAAAAEGGEQAGPRSGLSFETMEQQFYMVKGVVDVLMCVLLLLRDPPLLSATQLLACQLHRLLAAACALAAALPAEMRGGLVGCVAALVIMLASHEALCAQVRNWLAPPPDASCGGGGGGGSGDGDEDVSACAGCLEAPVRALMHDGIYMLPPVAVRAAVLLRLATGEIAVDAHPEAPGCGGGDGGVLEEEDRAFRKCAMDMAGHAYQIVQAICSGTIEGLFTDAPTDAETLGLMRLMLDVDGQAPPPPPPPSAPWGALPPPLALPPSRAGAFPRLRVCGNPRCASFAYEREGFIQLKQCGRCRTVRYCGADCQRAHWREGHRAECLALAAVEEER